MGNKKLIELPKQPTDDCQYYIDKICDTLKDFETNISEHKTPEGIELICIMSTINEYDVTDESPPNIDTETVEALVHDLFMLGYAPEIYMSFKHRYESRITYKNIEEDNKKYIERFQSSTQYTFVPCSQYSVWLQKEIIDG